MKQWFLFMPNEDGEPICPLEEKEIENIKGLMENYGVENWLSEFKTDPNNWNDGDAMLIKAEIIVPKPIKVVEEYRLEENNGQ